MKYPHQKLIDWLFGVYYSSNPDKRIMKSLVAERRKAKRAKVPFHDQQAAEWVAGQLSNYPRCYIPPVDSLFFPDDLVKLQKGDMSLPDGLMDLVFDFKVRMLVELLAMTNIPQSEIADAASTFGHILKVHSNETVQDYLDWFWDYRGMQWPDRMNFFLQVHPSTTFLARLSNTMFQDAVVEMGPDESDGARETDIEKEQLAEYYMGHGQLFHHERSPSFVLAAVGYEFKGIALQSLVDLTMKMVQELISEAVQNNNPRLATAWSNVQKAMADVAMKASGGGNVDVLSEYFASVFSSEKGTVVEDPGLTMEEILAHNAKIDEEQGVGGVVQGPGNTDPR